MGSLARAVAVAPGFGLGLGLTAGGGRGAATRLGGWLAAVFGFSRAAGAGFAGVCRRPAWPVVGCEAAWALAVAGRRHTWPVVGCEAACALAVAMALAVGTGFGRWFGRFIPRLGVLDEDEVVAVDEVFLVVDVVE